jgi:type II secretory pathway component GspD/PulD (secretin)
MANLAMVLGASLALVAPAWAQDRTQEKKLVFAFKEASIEAVLLYVSQVTGWIFVQEAPSRGTVTAYSNAEVPVSRCMEFLNVTLRHHGLAVRNPTWPHAPLPGETLRVLDLGKAAPTLPGVHVGIEAGEIPVTDELRTQIILLKFVSAAEVGKDLGDVLRKAVGEGGQVAISTYSNSILLTGRSEGIHRVAEILRVIDQAASAQLKISVFPLEYANAVEVAKTLNDFFKREPAKPDPGSQTPLPGLFRMLRAGADADRNAASSRSLAHEMIRITAEPRTNAVIVSATDENLDLIKGLLQRLDCPAAALITYVVPMRGTDAVATAALLNALWNAENKAVPGGRNQARSDGTVAPGQVPFISAPSTTTPRGSGGSSPRR